MKKELEYVLGISTISCFEFAYNNIVDNLNQPLYSQVVGHKLQPHSIYMTKGMFAHARKSKMV